MSTSTEPQPRHEAVWLSLILALGTAIRLWGLASWDWEGDELYTLRDAATLRLHSAAGGGPGIAARPVYYVLQHLLLQVLPADHFWLRLPAFGFGVAGIAVTWWVGRRMFGGYAGLVAALLVALSPWHLYASQFARYWSLVYLLATATFGALAIAIDTDRRAAYLRVAALFIVGTLTHPTFAFPMVGAVLGLHLVTADGSLSAVKPTRTELVWLWLPVGVAGTIGFLVLKLIGQEAALQNASARGFLVSLRLVPAMVQWMSVAIAGAGLAACVWLFLAGTPANRRWASMTALGGTGALVLLFAASFRSAVYSDYGIAVLPLIYIAIGAAVARVGALSGAAAGPTVVAAGSLALGLASAPETISHLADGSRFDYRPAFEVVRHLGPDRSVTSGVDDIQRKDAPDLHYVPLGKMLMAGADSSFWLITSTRRYGLREGGPRLEAWIDAHCREVLAQERGRIDYRRYRVDLHWCGPAPLPTEPR
jgi:hypothetical protein